jgi:hypothetical protein
VISIRVGLLALVTAAAVAILAAGGAAWAYWSAQAGNVPVSSYADSVGSGSQPTVSASGTSVTLSWTATTTAAGRGVQGYLVNRYAAATGGTATAAAAGTCAAVPVTTVSCTESNVPTGTWYYTVTPVLSAWRGAQSARSAAATVSPVLSFALAWSAGSLTAGTAASLTITARSGGAADPSYTGGHALAFSGPATAPDGTAPLYPANPVSFTAGVATVPVTLFRAETSTLAVSDGTRSGGIAAAVTHGTASRFTVAAPASATAGTAFSAGVTATDAYRNTATAYAGNKTLSWSGASASPSTQAPAYPANPVAFTAGVATVPVTLHRAGSTALTVTDAGLTGTSGPIIVSPATASGLAWVDVVVSKGTPSVPCLFTCTVSNVTGGGGTFTARVAVTDAYGNTLSNLSAGGTVSLTAPAGGGFTSPSNPTNLAISTTGAAVTATFVFQTQSGGWSSNNVAAAAAGYASATATLSK